MMIMVMVSVVMLARAVAICNVVVFMVFTVYDLELQVCVIVEKSSANFVLS